MQSDGFIINHAAKTLKDESAFQIDRFFKSYSRQRTNTPTPSGDAATPAEGTSTANAAVGPPTTPLPPEVAPPRMDQPAPTLTTTATQTPTSTSSSSSSSSSASTSPTPPSETKHEQDPHPSRPNNLALITIAKEEEANKPPVREEPRKKTSIPTSATTTTATTSTTDDKKSFVYKVKRECCSLWCCVCYFTCARFKLHAPKMYMFMLFMMVLASTMINGGYISAIQSTLQTQYNMSTSKIGLIISSFDIMGVFAIPLLSYVGSRVNRARLMGICAFFFCVGTGIWMLPYFFGTKYTYQSANTVNTTLSQQQQQQQQQQSYMVALCNETATVVPTTTTTVAPPTTTTCTRDVADTFPFWMFILAQLCMSFGTAPIFSVGLTYLCDNIPERSQSLYTGIIYGAYALGPAIGYVMASVYLNIWLYPTEQVGITPSDPRWVGAWWIGFIVAGLLMLVFTSLMATYPETMMKNVMSQKEKNRLRRKKLMEQLETRSQISSISGHAEGCGGPGLQIEFKRSRLNTIDELAEHDIYCDDTTDGEGEPKEKAADLSASSSTTGETTTDKEATPTTVATPSEITSQTRLRTIARKKKHGSDNASQSSSIARGTTTATVPAGPPSFFCSCACCDSINAKWEQSCGKSKRVMYIMLKIKGFLKSLLTLVKNFRYSLLVLILSVECILGACFTNYMVMYTQNVYQLSSSTASILVGGVVVPSAIIGAVCGGIIVKKFKLEIEGCTRLIMVGSTIVLVGIVGLIFIHCPGKASIGISPQQSFSDLFTACNVNCNCGPVYNPVCGTDQNSYVSPCYAGCRFGNATGYYNCTCVGQMPNATQSFTATQGTCNRNCGTNLIFFLGLTFIVVAVEGLCITPATMILLKLVDKPLQTLSLGLLKCANTLLAFIPAPIVLSQIIDQTCVLWSSACVGDKGTCLEYNIDTLHYVLFGTACGIKVVSCILVVVFSFYIHKSFLLKHKYTKRHTLHHDANAVLTPKERYRIDSEVASIASSLDVTTPDETGSVHKIKKKKKKHHHHAHHKNRFVFDKNENANDAGNVVLKRHAPYQQDSLEFTNIKKMVEEGVTPTPDQQKAIVAAAISNAAAIVKNAAETSTGPTTASSEKSGDKLQTEF